jgi:hypothetical protein
MEAAVKELDFVAAAKQRDEIQRYELLLKEKKDQMA